MPLRIYTPFQYTPQTFNLSYLSSGASERGDAIASDNSGNTYVAGFTNGAGAGNTDALVAKFDSSGVMVWQRLLGGAGQDNAQGVFVDASDNVYIAGRCDSQGPGASNVLLAKYRQDGSPVPELEWQVALGAGGITPSAEGVGVDSSGNVYVWGTVFGLGAGSNDFFIAKYNQSGSPVPDFEWAFTSGTAFGQEGNSNVAVDAAGNVYVTGRHQVIAPAVRYQILVTKYDSSGSVVWRTNLTDENVNDRAYAIALDGSGNVYVAGETAPTIGDKDIIVAKFDTSGDLVWNRRWITTGQNEGYGIAVDNSDNVYVLGRSFNGYIASSDLVIGKWDSDGNLQWQNALGGSSTDGAFGDCITIDSIGQIVLTGETSSVGVGGGQILHARLPANGSGTGTYGAFTYISILANEQEGITGSPNSGPVVLTDTNQTGALTSVATTLTDQAGTLPQTIIA